jgi:hypothetical protein
MRKLAFTVKEEMNLLDGKNEDRGTALGIFFISTGTHPSVLAEWRKYELQWNENYISYRRPKTHKEIQFPWSRAMKQRFGILKKLKGKTRQTLWGIVHEMGLERGFKGICPDFLRHMYFINRGRLNHNLFDIANTSQTSLDTIRRWYAVGTQDRRTLKKDELKYLDWLMEA